MAADMWELLLITIVATEEALLDYEIKLECFARGVSKDHPAWTCIAGMVKINFAIKI